MYLAGVRACLRVVLLLCVAAWFGHVEPSFADAGSQDKTTTEHKANGDTTNSGGSQPAEAQFEQGQTPQPGRDLDLDPIENGQGDKTDTPVEGDTMSDQGAVVAEPEPEPVPVPMDADGPRYKVTKLILEYALSHSDLPSIAELSGVGVDLVLTETGYIAARPGLATVHVPLSSIDDELPHLPQFWFYASALKQISTTVVTELNSRGYIGVFVAPDPDEIEEGEDLRDSDHTSLRLIVRTARVAQIRSLGSGSRVPMEDRINHPAHQGILDRSPLQASAKPAEEGQEPVIGDLLRRDLLDDYVYRLNRHPGRRVDVAVSRAERPGGVVLDYLISENPPLLAYFQISNTGTEQTSEWRERFGLSHNQLTGNDDIFSLDYVTANFDASHSLMVSYEAPVFDTQALRWRVFGSWGEFTATDVGQTQDEFVGDNWSYGGEVIVNVLQHREFFMDFIFGARQDQIFVDNRATLTSGRENFFVGYLGLTLEQVGEVSSLVGAVTVERNYPGVANTEQSVIDNFGRNNVSDQWTLLNANISQSFYLEPLLNYQAWRDMASPETSTLAHEVVLSLKGQHSFGARLIPQKEQVAGGLYTVRGYNESATAGDTVVVGSVEYRFHLPRAFRIQPNPSKTPLFGKPFRFAPQQVYARPDWDLILKVFGDWARVLKADLEASEEHETLLSVGAGVEFQFHRNINVSVDWGVALEAAGGVEEGHNDFHIVATLLY